MKALLSVVLLSIASMTFAADLPTKPAAKEEQNCVKKDKKGNCPPAPKSPKPTPKKKAEAK